MSSFLDYAKRFSGNIKTIVLWILLETRWSYLKYMWLEKCCGLCFIIYMDEPLYFEKNYYCKIMFLFFNSVMFLLALFWILRSNNQAWHWSSIDSDSKIFVKHIRIQKYSWHIFGLKNSFDSAWRSVPNHTKPEAVWKDTKECLTL